MKGNRLTLLQLVAALWVAIIVVRLYDLQFRRHEHYLASAERQQQQVVKLHPPRGAIYDARDRELAVSVEVASLAADPTRVEDPQAVAAAIAEVITVDRARLVERLSSQRAFAWVKRKLDLPELAAAEALQLPGVFTLPESKRYYPMGSLSAHVLGYVGTDNQGLAGLEYLYEPLVASTPGRRTVMRDGRLATVRNPAFEVAEGKRGHDLYLTLDATIQHVAERELRRAVEKTHSRSGMVVVMDPFTGAVLAMASHPTFDPNRFRASPQSHWRNRVVMDAFEPGSTFKMATVAAALEANQIDPLQKIDCEHGGTVIDGVRISDHSSFGALTAREIITYSSNIGAIKLGRAAGERRFYDTIKKLGFGQPTGIDLPSESAGILRPVERWSHRLPAYISFGQGISITTLQLANAFAAIANGGDLLRPYLVRESRSRETGERRSWGGREVVGLTISPSSVTQVRSMLESVTREGTGKAAAIPGYRVAGKTGTAEKAAPGGGGYMAGKYVASFVGFAPADRPTVVCAVVLDEPRPPAYHGGDVAAPVFAQVVRQTLLYLGVVPDPPVAASPDEDWPDAVRLVAARPEVMQPSSNAGRRAVLRSAVAREPVWPGADLTPGTVPDLAGLSAREALRHSTAAGFELALYGHGMVARQQPVAGTELGARDRVEVWLAEGVGR